MTEVILGRGNRLHAVECAIVRLALKLPASAQDALLDLWDHAGHLPAAVVRLEQPFRAEGRVGTQAAAESALARLVLAEPVAPAAMASTRDAPGAAGAGARRSPLRGLQPQAHFLTSLLFGVRWQATDKHAQGSEQYRLAWLPMVDRWVVTASHDHAAPDGYKDRLLASMPHDSEVPALACESVVRYWQTLRRECASQRWSTCTGSGRLEDAAVQELADRVWPQPWQPARPAWPAQFQRSLETA